MKKWKDLIDTSFLEANARERAIGLVDEGTFTEFLDPYDRFSSPHLPVLGTAIQFDDGIVTGVGLIKRHPVFVVSMEGRFVGGSIGEVNGAKMIATINLALEVFDKCNPKELIDRRPMVVISFETGGVRLHEANAGLLAHAEVMDAFQDLRRKVPVVGLVGGKVGCFGGMGFVAAATDIVIMNEYGRMGLTGPEVIEQEVGKEEFDASDKALVYRITGGKHKYIIRDCNYLVEDKIGSFRNTLELVATMPMEDMEHMRRIGSLELLQEQVGFLNTVVGVHPNDPHDVWLSYGNSDPKQLSEMSVAEFLKTAIRRPRI